MASGVVSDKFRFVWIHVAKNASSTLSAELRTERYGGRATDALPRQSELRGYFSFAFLRDPVERLLSAYQEVSLRHEAGWRDIAERRFVALPEGMARFEAFVDELAERDWDPHVDDQCRHLEGFELDFLGLVEHLAEDLARVYERLGMGPVPELPRRRSREGRKAQYGYARHVIRPEALGAPLRERIRALYADDVALYERVLRDRAAGSRRWYTPYVRPTREPEDAGRLPWAPWPLPPPEPREHAPDPETLLERFLARPKRNVSCLDDVPAHLVTETSVRTRLRRPRASDPGHADRPWYPQLERAFLLHLRDAFIGDNVVMDDDHYFGLGRHWLGQSWTLYAGTREVRHLDAAVSIGGWGGEAFQLFVVAALPKLAMVLDWLEQPGCEHVKIVSHLERAKTAQWFWRTLGLRERVVQKPIDSKAGCVVHADHVYFPQYDPTIDSYGVYARNTLLPVRRRLGALEPGEQDRVLYLVREPSDKIRSVGNQDELLQALAKRLEGTRYRLEVFRAKDLDVDREQIARAKVLVGPHGGAFANMIFARPGTHVVEFLPLYRLFGENQNPRPVFWGLSQACGLEYWTSEPRNFHFQKPAMEVDVADVVHLVGRALEETPRC